MAGTDLTQQQRDDLQSLLNSPLDFPPEFKTWLPDFLAQNIPYLPASQIAGSETLKPWYGTYIPNETTTEKGVWGDLFPTAGPRVDEVSGGSYLVVWGYYWNRGGVGGALLKAGVSIDGNDPVAPAYIAAGFESDPSGFSWKAAVITVPSDGALHFVKLKFWFDDGGSGAFANCSDRWLMLIRIK